MPTCSSRKQCKGEKFLEDRNSSVVVREIDFPCTAHDADGWFSFTSSAGRTFWHHSSLGPPPWEDSSLLARHSAEVESYHQEVICLRYQEQGGDRNANKIRHHDMAETNLIAAKSAQPPMPSQDRGSSRPSPRPDNADELHHAFSRLDVLGTHGLAFDSGAMLGSETGDADAYRFGNIHERYRMQAAGIF